jgi:hypothetical protein
MPCRDSLVNGEIELEGQASGNGREKKNDPVTKGANHGRKVPLRIQ